MLLLDIHTHNPSPNEHIKILNGHTAKTKNFCSVGIHPWEIDDDWKSRFSIIAEAANRANVVAIGECGFDLIKSRATIDVQQEVFKQHIELSESTNKPIIIHLVKGQEQLLQLSKNSKHKQAWIIHGFRGKPEQAKQLINAGMYISFGEKFNPGALKATPLNRLFIESDDSNRPIAEIYKSIADVLGLSLEQLALQVLENAKQCRVI